MFWKTLTSEFTSLRIKLSYTRKELKKEVSKSNFEATIYSAKNVFMKIRMMLIITSLHNSLPYANFFWLKRSLIEILDPFSFFAFCNTLTLSLKLWNWRNIDLGLLLQPPDDNFILRAPLNNYIVF